MLRSAFVTGSALVILVAAQPNQVNAETGAVLVKFRGTVVTGGSIGSTVQGAAIFPGNSPDLIPGHFEDWWQAPKFVHFTFVGDGIDFNTATGPYSSPAYSPNSELRIKDGQGGEDALRYDGHSADVSLILLLSEGTEDSLMAGTGGLTGSVPRLSADGSAFRPCAVAPGGANYAGSCSMFATSSASILFNLNALSIESLAPDPNELEAIS